ncbi:MAG: S8 family serine peptidase [Opitutaceae bacterium]|nr:S8 family serine peptidase [Cytophagales bacterium]
MVFRILFLFSFIISTGLVAQKALDEAEQRLLNWHNKDLVTDSIPGMSTEKAYNELLKGKKSNTVIVGIIDSGVDTDHEDIKDNIWVNSKEIAGNGVDDDKNGYIDDINGWSFLSNTKDQCIDRETLEMTRIYKKFASRYENMKAEDVKSTEKYDYELYQKAKKEFIKKLSEAKSEENSVKTFYNNFTTSDSLVKAYLKKDSVTLEDLNGIVTEDEKLKKAVKMQTFLKESGMQKEEIKKYVDHVDDKLNYNLNVEFNPRTLLGDNPEVMDGKPYGSNDCQGPDPGHGTHVAGIVGAGRKNGKGLDGIADNVKIMSVRAVPDGDERDKDIALAIRYAVDNGASIINMSFGKGFSPEKPLVDEAVKYAETKGVLLIHAAGNDAQNTDKDPSFPSPYYYHSKTAASNWMSIGASTMQKGAMLPAFFSNYGRKTVDVFAPGHEIYSLKPGNLYEANSGTSMAAPMVTGLAALLKSYYPQLTCSQIIDIIMKSGTNFRSEKVNVPGSRKSKIVTKKVPFKKLSKTGKVINVYQAVKMAEQITTRQ